MMRPTINVWIRQVLGGRRSVNSLSFFSITRELIKAVKVTKIKKQSTQTIIYQSIF